MARTLEQIYGGYSEVEFAMRSYTDPAFWIERIFGHDMQDFHKEIVKLPLKSKRVILVAPTGFGKTEMLAIGFPLWLMWHKPKTEVLVISKSMPQSKEIIQRIRQEIEDNPFLQNMMPEDRTVSWTTTKLETKNRSRIYCKPYSENIKGYHVDYVICDEIASYPDAETGYSIYFRFVVTRANAKNGTVVGITTPEDVADLSALLESNPEYLAKTYKSEYPDGTLLWPSKFTAERLKEIRSEIGESAYQREYLCNRSAQAENALYPPHLIEHCLDPTRSFTMKPLEDGPCFLGCDFAIAEGKTADFDAYTVIQKVGGRIVLRHGERHRGFPVHAKVARIRELHSMFNCQQILLDESNLGHTVKERLQAYFLPIVGVPFDASNRNKMLLTMRGVLDDKRFILPRNIEDPQCLNYTNILIGEMLSFTEQKTKTRMISYKSTATHDDTVMSLVLACKGAEEQKDFVDVFA